MVDTHVAVLIPGKKTLAPLFAGESGDRLPLLVELTHADQFLLVMFVAYREPLHHIAPAATRQQGDATGEHTQAGQFFALV